MAIQTAYTPADATSYGYWTFKTFSSVNRPNWLPNLAIGNTIDATTAPPYENNPFDPRWEPRVVTDLRNLLGSVPANANQGFWAWTDTIESSRFGTPTTITSDPGGGNDTLVNGLRWIELTYDDVTDLIYFFGNTPQYGPGRLYLRGGTVTAHLTFLGPGWGRNTTP